MISRSTLIGALVVVELAIVGVAAKAVAGDGGTFSTFSAPEPGAPTQLDRTFAARGTPRVVIDVHDIDVVVQRGPESSVRIQETLRRSGFVSGRFSPVTASETSDGVRVASVDRSETRVMIGSFSHEVHILVPPRAQVEIVSGADVQVSGLRSKLIAHVEEGAIHVSDHRGDVDVSTGDGRIYLADVQGADIAAMTHDGRLYFSRVGADRIDAHTNSGRIYATDIRAVDGALTTAEGRVALSLAANSDATVTAKAPGDTVTVSGMPAVTSDDNSSSTLRVGAGRGRFEVSSDDGAVNVTQGANVSP